MPDTPLPSWNDTPTRAAIVAFVEAVTSAGSPDLIAPPERIAIFDNDGTLWTEKPVRIGRRPVVAVGNSNGDIEMLRFARTTGRPALRLLVNHDDAEREFAYQEGAERALARAAERDRTVVSVKNDWRVVFPEQ